MLFLFSDCQSLSLLRFQVKMQYSGYYLDYKGFLDSRIRGNDRFFCTLYSCFKNWYKKREQIAPLNFVN